MSKYSDLFGLLQSDTRAFFVEINDTNGVRQVDQLDTAGIITTLQSLTAEPLDLEVLKAIRRGQLKDVKLICVYHDGLIAGELLMEWQDYYKFVEFHAARFRQPMELMEPLNG